MARSAGLIFRCGGRVASDAVGWRTSPPDEFRARAARVGRTCPPGIRLLAKWRSVGGNCRRPIIRVNFSSHILRERRVRPICRTFDQAMFHRIPVNVIGVGREIGIVADLVFPEAVLPESVLSIADLSRRHHIAVDQMLTCVGRDSFYVSPTLRKVGVPGGQGPDGVEMVGKQNPGINAERMRVASFAYGGKECIARDFRIKVGLSPPGDDGEEIRRTGCFRSAVIWHQVLLLWRTSPPYAMARRRTTSFLPRPPPALRYPVPSCPDQPRWAGNPHSRQLGRPGGPST